jgi:hypothetical protein
MYPWLAFPISTFLTGFKFRSLACVSYKKITFKNKCIITVNCYQ